jgi:hypothetical protein
LPLINYGFPSICSTPFPVCARVKAATFACAANVGSSHHLTGGFSRVMLWRVYTQVLHNPWAPHGVALEERRHLQQAVNTLDVVVSFFDLTV